MGNREITIDTHALLWYLDKGQNKKLSTLALQAVESAERNGVIYVPAIVVMETFHIIEKGRFFLSDDRDCATQATAFLSMIQKHRSYQIIPIEPNLMRASIPLRGLKIHDRLIAATAMLTGSVLVSKDRAITDKEVNVLW